MAPGLIALIVVLVALFIIGFPIFVTPVVIYIALLVRTSKKKWRRDWPRKDAEESQMMEEGKVFGEDNKDYIRIVDREEAINYALSIANKDDVVLILGKGRDNYMAIGDKKVKYNDYEVIKRYFEK